MRQIQLLCILVMISFVATLQGQPYKDPSLPVETRVIDLLSRMTPEEKFRQLFMIPGDLGDDPGKYHAGIFGLQVNTIGEIGEATGQMLRYGEGGQAYESAIRINEIQRYFVEKSRLGIPIIAFDEALHGLVRQGATAFPQSIALAATWNPVLVHDIASAIAAECASRGIRQVLSPVVNVATDVRWGRTEETYGEDPFLVSEMGVAFVSAFERKGIITTPKHFVANVGEGGRDSYPIHWNERMMREIFLPPFEACIRKGGSRSVMTAYNSYDGTPCTAHDGLLNKLLKMEWGFGGFVISDAGGTGGANVLHYTAADYPDASLKSIQGGLDVIFQTDFDHHTLFIPPFLDGSLDPKTIDEAVKRVLRAKFELGLFEQPYVDPVQAQEWNGHPAHRALAKQAALESIVLLKNAGAVLPLSNTLKSIAVIGPDAAEARLGGYSGPGNDVVSILQGIRDRAGSDVAVRYAEGCKREDVAFETVPGTALSCVMNGIRQAGLRGEYFDNVAFSGEPVAVRCDEEIRFQWTLFSPIPGIIPYEFYSVRWTGKLTAPLTGACRIGIDGNDGYRLFLDGKLILDQWIKRTKGVVLAEVALEQGRDYDLRIEFYEPAGNAWFRLVWDAGIGHRQDEEMQQAVELASGSDVTVVVAGIGEGEFRDRARLTLPGRQGELIRRVAATGKPVVVVLVAGSAIVMEDWLDDVRGVMAAWYPGEAGGEAVAEALFGDYNPAGRLPITFPVFEGQLPLVYNHKPTGRGDDYLNLTGQPAFPFGFGLSYTTFLYEDAKLRNPVISPDDSTALTVRVTNTGARAGNEVLQLYIRDELSSVATPVMALKAFRRIHLKPGETCEVQFDITPGMLSLLNADMQQVVEPGIFRIMIGASSKDIRQKLHLTVSEK